MARPAYITANAHHVKHQTPICARSTVLRSPHTARLVQQRAAGDQATATALPELKEQLVNMSGRRNGVDLSENEVKVVVEHLKKFEGLGRKDPAKMDLSGTKWRVLFRHRPANGKCGPFVAKCTLDFPTEQDYIANICHLGGVREIDLVSDYRAKNDTRIDLNLVRNDFRLFGFKTGSADLGLKGYHSVKFADEDMRIFVTNMGSYFATIRDREAEAAAA